MGTGTIPGQWVRSRDGERGGSCHSLGHSWHSHAGQDPRTQGGSAGSSQDSGRAAGPGAASLHPLLPLHCVDTAPGPPRGSPCPPCSPPGRTFVPDQVMSQHDEQAEQQEDDDSHHAADHRVVRAGGRGHRAGVCPGRGGEKREGAETLQSGGQRLLLPPGLHPGPAAPSCSGSWQREWGRQRGKRRRNPILHSGILTPKREDEQAWVEGDTQAGTPRGDGTPRTAGAQSWSQVQDPCWDPASALGHSDKSSSRCAPSAQGGDRATSGQDKAGDTQGRQQDRGTTRDTDTQDKGQLRELLPRPAGNSRGLLLGNAKIHARRGSGAGLGTRQGCPQARPGPLSSCGAPRAGLGSSGSAKRQKRSLRYLGWELE